MKPINKIVSVIAILVVLVAPLASSGRLEAAASENPTPVFRFYKFRDGSHFFTNNEVEKSVVAQRPDIYRYEGIAFYSYPQQVSGSEPVHRFYNFKQGVHFYTSNQTEATQVNNTAFHTFRYEGVAYYAMPPSVSIPGNETNYTAIHRFYHLKQGVHFYTSNQAEAEHLRSIAFTTYRYEGSPYYLPLKLTFSGNGNQVTESFILPSTTAVFTMGGGSAGTNFIVTLYKANTGEYEDLLANEIGEVNTSVPSGVGENRYVLEVQSSSMWHITIEQPKTSAGLVGSFSGTGTRATQLFTMLQGTKTLSYSHDGTSNFIVTLWKQNGELEDIPVIEQGPVSGGTFILPEQGNYILGVDADGNWAISIN